jgi:two-component system, sensor histidine kinase
MRLAFWRYWSLAAQLTLMMATLVAIAVITITLLYVNREQANMRRDLQKQAEVILTTLITTQANALYVLDTDSLETAMEFLGDAQTGVLARIYDPDGRLVADSAKQQALTFGLEADPFGQELIGSEDLIARWNPGYLEAGQSVVVGNQVIGAISLQLSTTVLDAQLQATYEQGLLVVALAVGIGVGVSLLASRAITRPLQAITQVAERITGGDLSTRAEINTQNEIGQLARAFNQMIDAIQKRETDLREQAETLRIATAKAKESTRVKTEFLANMSHELRTPLSAIIGFSDTLLMGMSGELNPKQRHKMERVKENGQRLLALINNILDLTRIEARRIEITPKPFAPRVLAERLSAQMVVLAERNGLDFKTSIDPDVPSMLMGDEPRIEQIVVNLLSNAFKFTDKGLVTLSVFTNPDPKTWNIAVTDTGNGIPPHALDLIFEEFRQVDGSSTRAYQGSGLGLAITRNLVQLMDGHISVESEVGKGSTFTVAFPIIETTTDQVLEKAGV